MVDPKIVREWLNKAEEDFGFASKSLEDNNEFYSPICFHFQQAAEKYFKTFIVAHELEFRKIHNLLVLLNLCVKKEKTLGKLKESCQILNRYYVDTRYPAHWPSHFTRADAEGAKDAAIQIGNLIKDCLFKGKYI